MRAHVQHKGGRRKSKRKKCVINIFRATEMRRDATQRNASKSTQAEVDASRLSRAIHAAVYYKAKNNN